MLRITRVLLAVLGILVVLLAGRFAYMSLTTEPPTNLGAAAGRLATCPGSPNCVSSLAEREGQKVDPLVVSGSPDAALERVTRWVESMTRARVVTSENGYLHAEFASLLFRFVDDLELVYDSSVPGFHVRSASRTGYSDLGANRKRVQALRAIGALDEPE